MKKLLPLFLVLWIATQAQAQLDITHRTGLVGICYSVYHKPKNMPNYDISKVLRGKQRWGPKDAYHFWAEPYLGYHSSVTPRIVKQHMKWLQAAEIDFIIVDQTNLPTPGPVLTLLNTILEMRTDGIKTPNVILWCNRKSCYWAEAHVLRKRKYQDLFVKWHKKIFILLVPHSLPPAKWRSHFYSRVMWGLQKHPGRIWQYLSHYPQYAMGREHISVSVALQRTYMSNRSAITRHGGRTFALQWRRAFKIHPKIVTITWWNEWGARRIVKHGRTYFTDNFTEQASRDVAPMKGGHGFKYYRLMKDFVAKYKRQYERPRRHWD